MPSYNRVILMGNLTRDPELRYTPSGQAVADLRVAMNRRVRTSDGERRDEATFVDVTAWGRQAEVISQYLSKGQPIFLEGRLSLDEWTSQDGQRRSKLRVVLENFQFVSPRGSGPAPAPAPRRQGAAPAQAQPTGDSRPAPDGEGESFDDVPF